LLGGTGVFGGTGGFGGAAEFEVLALGACLSIPRGRDRGRFPLRQGGADEVG